MLHGNGGISVGFNFRVRSDESLSSHNHECAIVLQCRFVFELQAYEFVGRKVAMHSLPGLPQVDDDFAFGDGSANLVYLASLPAIGGGAAGGALALPADVVGNGIVQESMDCEFPGLPIVSEVCACSQPLAASTSALPYAGGHGHVDALPEVPDNANMSQKARFRTRNQKNQL